jgi:hypothetical protein
MFSIKKTVISTAVLMALSTGAAHAISSTGNNFTMVGGTGGLTGGTNDVVFTWDSTLKTSVVTDGTNNATLSSITPFSGNVWTAHNVNMYAPGTYVFDTTCTAGNPSCGTGTASQKYTLTVPTGYIGAHMLFNWSTTINIDVIELWKLNDSWANVSGTFTSTQAAVCASAQPTALTAPCTMKNPMSLGAPNPNGNTINTVWSLVSIDTNQDTDVWNGSKMLDGPFKGQSANFNITGIPVPAAVWLMGSGLAGLAGVARRRKAKA